MPSRGQKKDAKRLAARSNDLLGRRLDWRKRLSPAKPMPPPENLVLKEDVFKLMDFGLSADICRVLSFGGLADVAHVVRTLKDGMKIRQIGPAREYKIRKVLEAAGVNMA